jgi:hypothetical protein
VCNILVHYGVYGLALSISRSDGFCSVLYDASLLWGLNTYPLRELPGTRAHSTSMNAIIATKLFTFFSGNGGIAYDM